MHYPLRRRGVDSMCTRHCRPSGLTTHLPVTRRCSRPRRRAPRPPLEWVQFLSSQRRNLLQGSWGLPFRLFLEVMFGFKFKTIFVLVWGLICVRILSKRNLIVGTINDLCISLCILHTCIVRLWVVSIPRRHAGGAHPVLWLRSLGDTF